MLAYQSQCIHIQHDGVCPPVSVGSSTVTTGLSRPTVTGGAKAQYMQVKSKKPKMGWLHLNRSLLQTSSNWPPQTFQPQQKKSLSMAGGSLCARVAFEACRHGCGWPRARCMQYACMHASQNADFDGACWLGKPHQ